MTNVFIEIIQPNELYDILAVPENNRMTDNTFTEKLREELQSSLISCGVKNVTVKIMKTKSEQDNYKIVIHNVKNDWQEEQIRVDCDDVCLSFMRKENLTKMKTDIII